MNCRHCKKELKHSFLDLGFAPPSNAYVSAKNLNSPEIYFPLRIKVCDSCWLVQTEDYAQAHELFTSDYAYFSSTSSSWLEHSKQYVDKVTNRFSLDSSNFVIEVASNDGYLLKNFVDQGIPCLGIEPTQSTADEAERKNVTTLRSFFGSELASQLAEEGKKCDLIIGNNVYAHVPDVNDFTLGLKKVLKDTGVVTLEFPHLLNLIKFNQFDTVYHEHYSYLSLLTVKKIFQSVGLRIFDVEEISTHGGSLRVYGCHEESTHEMTSNVKNLLQAEVDFGLLMLKTYTNFQAKADKIKNDFVSFLIDQKRLDKKIVGYGAAAKGNTLLNYAGIKIDLLPFVCDLAASKQGKFLPGNHLPILKPEMIQKVKPDFIVIFPWNLKKEVMSNFAEVSEWGCKFVVAVPELKIL